MTHCMPSWLLFLSLTIPTFAASDVVAVEAMAKCPTPETLNSPEDITPPRTEFNPQGWATYALSINKNGRVLAASLRERHVTTDERWFKDTMKKDVLKLKFKKAGTSIRCEIHYNLRIKDP